MVGNKTAILFLAHQDDPDVLDEFRNLRASCAGAYDVFLVFHQADGRDPSFPIDIQKNLFCVTGEKIEKLELLYLSADSEAMVAYEGGKIYGGNAGLLQLCFFSNNNSYEYYWCVEYDVRFTGEWRDFFDAFGESEADLVTTSVVRYDDDPDWIWWPLRITPDGPLDDHELIRSFNPVYRLSKRASELLIRKYHEGWCAHYELMIPTLIHRCGFVVEDIGGRGEFVPPGCANRFYVNTPSDPHMFPGTFRYRPIMSAPGARRNTLWHPVKPAQAARLGSWRLKKWVLREWLRVLKRKL